MENVTLYSRYLAGVALTSYSHKENLVAAMFDGRKRPLP